MDQSPVSQSPAAIAIMSQRLDEIVRMMDLRFKMGEQAVVLALDTVKSASSSHNASHEREHASAENLDSIRREAEYKTDAERRRALDKAEESINVRLAASNQWQQRFDALHADLVHKEMLDTQLHAIRLDIDKIELGQPMFMTQSASDARVAVAQADRDRLREQIAACVRVETYVSKMESIDGTLREVRDWKLQTESQFKTWAAVVTFLVIVVNIAIKYL